MSELITFMKTMAGIRGKGPAGYAYGSREDFVLREGRAMPWRKKPRDVKYGEKRMCFMNALHLAAATGWTYCEGFAMGHIGVLHAWVIDDEGFVVDNTWRPEQLGENPEYFGVEMDEVYVYQTVTKKKTYGVISDYEARLPILKNKWDPDQRQPAT